MNGELLKPEEIALRLRVDLSWVYRNADRLGVIRVGKYLRFSWDRVLNALCDPEALGDLPNDQK